MPKFTTHGPINIRQTDSAPSLPGLYVWYAKLTVGEADWNSAFAGGDQAARDSLGRVITDHCMKFGKQEININATANFATVWTGTLHEEISKRWGRMFEAALEDDDRNRFQTVLSNDETRRTFLDLVDTTFPLFYAPIYIGTTTDQTLYERLSQHSTAFLNIWDRIQDDPELTLKLTSTKNFAERAASLGFGPADLFYSCIAVQREPTDQVSPAYIAQIIEFAERMLNRWATPILGKD